MSDSPYSVFWSFSPSLPFSSFLSFPSFLSFSLKNPVVLILTSMGKRVTTSSCLACVIPLAVHPSLLQILLQHGLSTFQMLFRLPGVVFRRPTRPLDQVAPATINRILVGLNVFDFPHLLIIL